VCDSDLSGVLAVHSLSKRSNLAGYRAGFVAGDPALVGELLAVRKHAGMIVPAPVQAAMVAALSDESHVVEQRGRYARRRARLREALTAAGFTIEHSEAGLYLWCTRGEDGWATVDWFADRGILVAPGEFYGPAGSRHVRVALTASDEGVDAAVARLAK
jgi:aspartate/methionine/tyrosine aminotransferase